MKVTSKTAGIALTIASGVFFGTIPIFSTPLSRSGIGVWFQAVSRLAVTAILFAIALAVFQPGALRIRSRRQAAFLLANSLLITGAFATYLTAISTTTSAAKTILLVYLSPVFSVLIAAKVLGERLTPRKGLAVALGVLGAAVTVRIWDLGSANRLQLADALAIMNSVIGAGMVTLGRVAGARDDSHPIALTLWTFTFALIWLFIAGLVLALRGGLPAILPSADSLGPQALLRLAGLVALGTAAPYLMMYTGLRSTEAGTASTLLLTEPVSVFVFAAVFLGQPLEWWHAAGGAIILAASVIVSRPHRAV